MKVVFISIGTGFVVFLVVFLIGVLLPEKHMVSRTVQLRAPVSKVWQTITDHKGSVQWRTNLAAVDQVEVKPGTMGWREIEKNGDAINYHTVNLDPERQMIREITDKNLPFGGTWTFDLNENAEGVLLTITENGEVYNPIFRVMSRFVFGYYASIDRYFLQLSKFLEIK